LGAKSGAITRKLNKNSGLTKSKNRDIIKSGGEGLEQKRRDKKVFITDVAIQNIKKVDIDGFSDAQNKRLQELHKDLLTTAKNRNNSNEVLKVWNTYTNEVVEMLGSENNVDPSGNPYVTELMHNSYFKELVFLHNHPSASGFSGEDVKTFLKNPEIGVMTVVTNQGEVYLLRKNDDFSFEKADNFIKDLCKKNLDEYEVFAEFLKKGKKVGVIYGKPK
jgi:hypothetical protein